MKILHFRRHLRSEFHSFSKQWPSKRCLIDPVQFEDRREFLLNITSKFIYFLRYSQVVKSVSISYFIFVLVDN